MLDNWISPRTALIGLSAWILNEPFDRFSHLFELALRVVQVEERHLQLDLLYQGSWEPWLFVTALLRIKFSLDPGAFAS